VYALHKGDELPKISYQIWAGEVEAAPRP
jgi:hypothetical protein